MPSLERHPINSVRWADRDLLSANDYNPNVVARPELELLKLSIVKSGWTQPIVARTDGTIVDGFHRWLVAADPEVAALTDGKVPVVFLGNDTPYAEQVAATIRHNRARGVHGVIKMADIVHALLEKGVDKETLMESLGMEDEEVDRLYDRGKMVERGAAEEFGKGWVPAGAASDGGGTPQ